MIEKNINNLVNKQKTIIMKKLMVILMVISLSACVKQVASPVSSNEQSNSATADTVVLIPGMVQDLFEYQQIVIDSGTFISSMMYIVESVKLPKLSQFSTYFDGAKKKATNTYSNDTITVAFRRDFPLDSSQVILLKGKPGFIKAPFRIKLIKVQFNNGVRFPNIYSPWYK